MKRIHYCKSLKKTGKPIIVLDTDTNKEYNTDLIEMRNVNIRVAFNNSKGKESRRGATTILEVF